MTLDEQRIIDRAHACGNHAGGHFTGGAYEFSRILPNRDGVHVDNAKQALVILLQRHPVANGAQIIAEVKIARGLNARQDAPGFLTERCGPASGHDVLLCMAHGWTRTPSVNGVVAWC